MEHKEIVKNLVIIGSIIGIIQSILAFANLGFGFWGLMLAANILLSLFGLIISTLTLLSVVQPGNPIPYKAVILLVFGVLMTLFNAWIGGILVLIAFILWLVWKL